MVPQVIVNNQAEGYALLSAVNKDLLWLLCIIALFTIRLQTYFNERLQLVLSLIAVQNFSLLTKIHFVPLMFCKKLSKGENYSLALPCQNVQH